MLIKGSQGGLAALFALFLVGWPSEAAQAARISVGTQYGEPIDQAPIQVSLLGNGGFALDCSAPPVMQRQGTQFTITVRRHGYGTPGGLSCNDYLTVPLGTLPVGTYRLVVIELDEWTGLEAQRQDQEFDVLPVEGRCSELPGLAPQLVVYHRTLSPDAFIRRLANDPAYAELLGNPVPLRMTPGLPGDTSVWLTYPPLDDPGARHFLLDRTGEFSGIGRNAYLFGVPPGDTTGVFVEFYNDRLDHYFYTSAESEIAAIEAGRVGPGWSRTGEAFNAYVKLGQPYGRTQRVGYRFTGRPDVGPSTHVFTVNREECYKLAHDSLWLFEGAPIAASPVARDGSCAVPGEIPLHRLWKPFGISNHRFTVRPAIVDSMAQRGWVNEGPAMCVLARPLQ